MTPPEHEDLNTFAEWFHYWADPAGVALGIVSAIVVTGYRVVRGLVKRVDHLEREARDAARDVSLLKTGLGDESRRVCNMIVELSDRMEKRHVESLAEVRDTRRMVIDIIKQFTNGRVNGA